MTWYYLADLLPFQVFPTSVRAIGLGTCSAVARIGAMVTPFAAQVISFYLEVTPVAAQVTSFYLEVTPLLLFYEYRAF